MVKKIAVLGVDALDEFIFVLPALQALRENFKDAEIIYLGKESHYEYLKDRVGPVDRVVIVPPVINSTNENNLSIFFTEMQKEQFDIAFQLSTNVINQNAFIVKLGAKLTAGFATPGADKLDVSIPYINNANQAGQYLEVISKAGIKTRFIQPRLAVTENDFVEAYSVLGNSGDNAIALIHPFTNGIKRQWPYENFIKVADFLADKGYHVCIIDVDVEEQTIHSIMSKVVDKDEIQHLPTNLSLAAITGLSSLASIVVGNDSSSLFVARALQTRTVGVFWCGTVTNTLPPQTTIQRNLRSWTSHCPMCGLSTLEFNETGSICKHNTSFVAEITVDEMKDAINELLAHEKEERDDEQITISA